MEIEDVYNKGELKKKYSAEGHSKNAKANAVIISLLSLDPQWDTIDMNGGGKNHWQKNIHLSRERK